MPPFVIASLGSFVIVLLGNRLNSDSYDNNVICINCIVSELAQGRPHTRYAAGMTVQLSVSFPVVIVETST